MSIFLGRRARPHNIVNRPPPPSLLNLILAVSPVSNRRIPRRFGLLLGLLYLLAPQPSASAEGVTTVFAAPSQPLLAGKSVTLILLCVNDTEDKVDYAIPPTISGRLHSANGGPAQTVELRARPGAVRIAIEANSFRKVAYQFDVPPTLQGQALLEVPDFNRLKLTLNEAVAAAPPATGAPPAGTAVPTAPPGTTATAAPAASPPPPLFGSFFTSHVTPYEPIFFLIGTHPSVEFQLSLKVQLLDWLVAEHPWDQIYLGYTQTSFWDLITSDPSFYDTSYKPSVFYAARMLTIATTPEPLTFSNQLGFEHESNGDGGINERSQNTVYYQPLITYGDRNGLQFLLQPRFWYYASVGDNNKDLAAYRGYGDLRTALTWKGFQLATKFEIGSGGKHPAIEVDLMADLRHYLHLDPAFQVQYFDGYGQSFRDYDKIDHGLRAGISLWYPGIDAR